MGEIKERLEGLADESGFFERKMKKDWDGVNPNINEVKENIQEVDKAIEKVGKTSTENFDKVEHSMKRMSKASEDLSMDMKRLNTNIEKGFDKSKRQAKQAESVVSGGGDGGFGGRFGGMGTMAAMGSTYAMIMPYMATQNVVQFSKQMGNNQG